MQSQTRGGGKKKRQPGDEPERCWRSNPSPRTHNHHDQLGGQSTGLLFYIRTAISLDACEARWVFIPVLEGMFSECGRKRGEKHVIKGRKHMQKQRVQGKQVVPSWFARLAAAAAALSPQTCRDDLQINRKIGSAAGQPPFHLWLCTRAVLPTSGLSRFGYKCVCCHFLDE